MKLIQIMQRGPNKTLAQNSYTSASMAPAPLPRKKGFVSECKGVSVWFAKDDGGLSDYRVDMDRADAMELRDRLNRWFPESHAETLGTVLNRRKNLS